MIIDYLIISVSCIITCISVLNAEICILTIFVTSFSKATFDGSSMNQLSKHGSVSYLSIPDLGYKETTTKYRSLFWKPRNNVIIELIYRAWLILREIWSFSFLFVHAENLLFTRYSVNVIIIWRRCSPLYNVHFSICCQYLLLKRQILTSAE